MKRLICYAEKVLILLKYCCLVVLSAFSNTNEKNCILMDLTDMPINRRTVQIFLQLRQTGYQVYFRFFPRQFVNGYYYRKTDYQNILFRKIRLFNRKKRYAVAFCSKQRAAHYEKKIVINEWNPASKENCEGHFFYPILSHPLKLEGEWEQQCLKEQPETKIGFVFIGATGDAYTANAESLHRKYQVETRNEVIHMLMDRFFESVYRPESREQLMQKLSDPSNDLKRKIVIIDRFRLSGKDYSKILIYSAFQIWTAGYIQPYCHNQAEGMACGCIPVYNRRICYPGLTEDNSFSYYGLDMLASVLQNLLDFGVDRVEIERKREYIRQNYIKNLSFQSFYDKLEAFIASGRREEIYYLSER